MRVCFSYLVQKELDEVKESWNHHHISRSRQAVVPNGKPVLLFSTPEVYGMLYIFIELEGKGYVKKDIFISN